MDIFRRANRPLYNTHLSTSSETMTRISNCSFCTLSMVSKASVIQIWTVAKSNFRGYLLLIDHLPHASIPFWLACDRNLYELCLAEAFSTNMLQGLRVLRGMLNSGPLHLSLCYSQFFNRTRHFCFMWSVAFALTSWLQKQFWTLQ